MTPREAGEALGTGLLDILEALKSLESRVHAIEAKLSRSSQISPEAQAIYSAYPKKVARPAALRAIQRLLNAGVDSQHLLARTKAYADAWAGQPDKAFMPHPATWFGQHRYQDHPDTWVPRKAQPTRQDRQALLARLADVREVHRIMPSDLLADQITKLQEQLNQ